MSSTEYNLGVLEHIFPYLNAVDRYYYYHVTHNQAGKEKEIRDKSNFLNDWFVFHDLEIKKILLPELFLVDFYFLNNAFHNSLLTWKVWESSLHLINSSNKIKEKMIRGLRIIFRYGDIQYVSIPVLRSIHQLLSQNIENERCPCNYALTNLIENLSDPRNDISSIKFLLEDTCYPLTLQQYVKLKIKNPVIYRLIKEHNKY